MSDFVDSFAYTDSGNSIYRKVNSSLRSTIKNLTATKVKEYPVIGLDISRYDGVIKWDILASKISFLFIKASESTNWKDPNFTTNQAKSKEYKIPRGYYHFLRQVDPIRQYDNFMGSIGKDFGELPAVCDVEDRTLNLDVANVWCEKVENATGRTPIIYTSYYAWKDCGGFSKLWTTKYDLWIANYGVSQPSIPLKWTTWKFWQYTDRGEPTQFGITQKSAVDINYWNGTLEELKIYCGIKEQQVPEYTDKEKLEKLWLLHKELH